MPTRPLLLLALVALLAGCGGDPSPQEVARDYVTSNEPAKCKLLTRELLERQTGRRGEEALRYCEANVVREPAPPELRIIETEVRHGRALVEVVVGDEEERIELVKRSGGWRIVAFPR